MAKKNYYNIRDSKGRFRKKYKYEEEEEEIDETEKYYKVHIKISYKSDRGKSHNLFLDGYSFVKAKNKDEAETIFIENILDEFGGHLPEDDIIIHSEEITIDEIEKHGVLMWKQQEEMKWRQKTLSYYS